MDGKTTQNKVGEVIYVDIDLSRRNLVALLTKLDDPDSVRTIAKKVGDTYYTVTAVEDFAAYGGGIEPGSMSPKTERDIAAFYSNHYTKDEDDAPCQCNHCPKGGE